MNDLLKTLGIPEKPVNPQRAVAQKQKELKSIVRAGKRPANPLEQIAYKAPGFKAPSGVSMPKPQPKPVARPYSDPLGMGIASLLQSQPPRVDTQMQAHIRRTQPVTANMGFAVGREESPSIEREMAEYDLRHFGRETYGEQPGDISDSDYAKRTLYRERITKRFGWDSSGRIAQEENLNREIEAHKPENMTPQQRLELVKEAAGGFNPLNVLAGPAAMIPGVHGYLDEGRDALAGKLLGENPNLANLDDAGLALNAINQAMSPVSTAKSVLGRDPRTMTELPDWEQAALTLGDIASQVGLGSLTGGTATGPALSRLGQGALKYLAMDVPGYVQMVRDSGGAENALKQYGGMIRDALDFTKNVPMSQRLQGAALAIAIAMSPAALAKGKVRPDATPPKITEQAPSVPESIPGVRGEMGGVGLDAEPPLRPGVQEPVAGGKAQKGAVKPDLAALTKEFDDLHPEPPPAKEGLNLTAKQKEGYTAAWEHHQGKKSEAPPVVKPPVVKPPKAIKPPEPQMTKPRQADVKSVADAIGLDLTKERKTVPEIAKAVEDGGYVESSAASAQKALDGKALNTEEQVGLAMGINNTKAKIKELDAALRKAKNAKNDVRAQEIIKLRDEQVQTHKLLLQGLQKARSESGRSLGAGSTFELADYAIPSDVITLAEAKVKGEIPEAKRKQLEADSERYAAMERDLKDAQESIKTSREREAALEKRLADAAIKRAPRAGKTGRIPVDAAKQALKELGAFEPVVGAMPVFSPKQSRAFSTLAKWAIGEVKTAGDVTTDAVVAKMRDLVEKNNVGHVLFDEDYYRAIRQALLGDKSGSYSGLLDDADTWLNQRARQFDETVSADKQSAKVQGDWDKAFKDADKKAEAQARAERLNDIKDAMDATPRNRNAEKLAQGLIKGGNKDFSAIVKAIQGKYKLTDIEAASSARRAVWSMEAGLQRRFGRDLMDASLDVRQKQAELKAIKDEIDYNIEKLSPQSLPTKLRVGLRAFAFSNPVNRVLDVAFNGLRLGAETVGKPVDAVLESAWMLALPKNARRSIAKPQFMATSRRALEASKAIKQGMWADAVQNFKFGDTALLEKQGFPKVGMNSKNEAVNKGFNFLARLPGYTDIPARRTWYEISLLELVDNEVDFMAKQNNWTPTQKSQHRKMMLDNANGELEPLRLAAANAADELVFANTTKFDKIISAGEQGLKKVIGESAGDWVMLGSDVFVTPYLRIFAKITGYGTDHLWGGLKAVTEAGTSKAKTGKVPAHVRRRVIELSRRQMFGLAIGYAATEWYKQAKQSENGKDQLDRYVQLKNGYVDIPEPLKASGVMTPFLLTIGLKRIDDSGGTPAQKDAWRKDLFSSLAIETPLMSGTSDLGRAISLQDDPLKFATRKIANAVIPGAVRQASKMMDREKDSQPWEMRERPVNTKPDTSNSLKTRKDGSTYISEKTWAEQDRLKSTVNELKARIPGLRNQLPTKK